MRTRYCPVSAACAPLSGWEEFLAHIHQKHTRGSEEERLDAVQAHLERGPQVFPLWEAAKENA